MAASDAFYNEVAADAKETIVEFGKQFDVIAKATTNLETLEVSEGATRKVWGVVTNGDYTAFVTDSSVQWTASKTLILSHDANPAKCERVNVDGKLYDLDKLVPIKPADVVVIYLLDISK